MKWKQMSSLLALFFIISCASSFSKRTLKRTIHLKKLHIDSLKVGIENEHAIILFQRFDIVSQFEKSYKKDPAPELKKEIEKLKRLSKDSIVDQLNYRKAIMGWDYELVYYKLLKKGKSQVQDKHSKSMVDKIIFEKYKTRLGSEDAYFSFKARNKFYQIMLAIGE